MEGAGAGIGVAGQNSDRVTRRALNRTSRAIAAAAAATHPSPALT
jgi:hypothetical protein